MDLNLGRHRAPARPRPRGHRAVVLLSSSGLVVVGALATSSSAQSSTTPGRISVLGVAAPTAFTAPHAGDAARAAEMMAAATEQTRQARRDALDLASRRAARTAMSASQSRREERERAERAARQAAADRQAARAAQARAERLAKAHRWVLPIKHPNLSSPFGHRWGRLHAGLDFSTPVGTALVAMSSGVVAKAEPAGGYGLKVEIRYWDGTVSYFAHMSELAVEAGDRVHAGSYVGKSGNTGNSTGPHLHLEIHPDGGDPVDPATWLEARHVVL